MDRTLLVCVNVDCQERGSEQVLAELRARQDAGELDDVDEIVKADGDGTVVQRLTENTDRVTRNLIFTVLEAGLLPGDI